MFTITSRLVMAVTVPSTTSPTATFDSVLSYSSAICSFGWSYTPRSFSKAFQSKSAFATTFFTSSIVEFFLRYNRSLNG